jgi:hypothetical protein
MFCRFVETIKTKEMKTIDQIREELKNAKIGVGCKFIVVRNCITINYPQHKIVDNNLSCENSQMKRDVDYISNHYSLVASNGTTKYEKHFSGNKGSVQIYIMN